MNWNKFLKKTERNNLWIYLCHCPKIYIWKVHSGACRLWLAAYYGYSNFGAFLLLWIFYDLEFWIEHFLISKQKSVKWILIVCITKAEQTSAISSIREAILRRPDWVVHRDFENSIYNYLIRLDASDNSTTSIIRFDCSDYYYYSIEKLSYENIRI